MMLAQLDCRISGATLRTVALALALTVAWAPQSSGGVVDSPLPVLTSGGKAAVHVFTVPGVMKVSNLETEFSCTSLATTSFKFGVEIFPPAGGVPLNDVSFVTGNGAATLAPGGTWTITTGSTVALHEDSFISGLGSSVRNGSARIVSESKAITCMAFVADRFGTKRCGGPSTNGGAVCTIDADCTLGGIGSCRTTPDSFLKLTVISKTKQKGE